MIKLASLIMVIALTGCANILTPQIKYSVTANHQFSDTNTDNSISAPDAVNRATTYKFAPTDAQLKSPEYLQYEFILRQHLLQNGFAAVANNQSPDVLVTFSYHIDEGTEKQRTALTMTVILTTTIQGRATVMADMVVMADMEGQAIHTAY